MSSVNLREANFRGLLQSYYTSTSAQQGLQLISSYIRDNQRFFLERLLRDHRLRGNGVPDGPEADGRSAFDKLLKCCSVMEIAAQACFIPQFNDANAIQHDWALSIRAILDNDLARRYYEEYYPEKNPQLLRYRLMGCTVQSDHAISADDASLIIRFLNLDTRFINFLEDGAGHFFLKLLDDWSENHPASGRSYRFTDIIDIISDPKQFTGILLRPVQQDDPRSSAVYGFVFFLSFSVDLLKLLKMFSSQSLLPSAIWYHYGYWFKILGMHLQKELSVALSQFLSWALPLQQNLAEGGDPDVDLNSLHSEIQNYVDETQKVIEALVSSTYSEAVDSELARLATACSISNER